MKRTKEKPKIAGHYWYKRSEDCDWETVEVIHEYGYLRIYHIGDERDSRMKELDGCWSDSPIKEPE